MAELHSQLSPPPATSRAPQSKAIPMRVLSLGLSRTGTCSIQAALHTLGIPCFHFLDLLSNTEDCLLWDKALDATFQGKGRRFSREDWDQLLARYGAVADMPAFCFAEELVTAYPEAKVILCTRDIDSWYKSFDENVITDGFPPIGNYLAYLDPTWTGRLRWLGNKVMKVYFHGETQDEMRKNAKEVFRRHYALVRKVTPKERLLEYSIDDGWEPICSFLGVQIPDHPFPRVNDTAAAKERMKRTILETCKRSAGGFTMLAVSVGVVALLWQWWYNRRQTWL